MPRTAGNFRVFAASDRAMVLSSCSLRRLAVLSCGALVSSLAGCASNPAPRYVAPRPHPEAIAPIPEMAADGTFFDGQIAVVVLLNRGGFAARAGERNGDRGDGEAGRGSGGFRGGFGGGGRGRRGGEGAYRGGEDEGAVPRIRAENQPPVQLHLRLTNHGAAPVQIAVSDFESDLGNFVVQPERITVPANGYADADPMTSRLGVTSSTLPLTVQLRRNGRVETQTLSLHLVVAAAPPVPTPPAGS